MNNITIVKGQGGLGRALPGEDYISGMLFFATSLPSGFSSTDRIKKVFSIGDAEALGINHSTTVGPYKSFSDETKATGTYQVTTAGTDGDTVELKWQEPLANVSLGVYTKVTADSTATLVATAIKNLINLGTATHGYTATSSTDTVTITARPGLGVFANSGSPLTKVIVGATHAGTIGQPSGGVASLLAIYHYHIDQYFRIQPKGVLYVGFYAADYTFAPIQTIQNFASGTIRQFGVYVNTTTHVQAHVTAIQTICDTLAGLHKPVSNVILGPDVSATTIAALATLASLDSESVSVCIAQDGAATSSGVGYELFKAYAKSITAMGACLGAVSLAAVHEDIAWVSKFNMSDGTEFDTLAFATGEVFSTAAASALTTLDTQRYIYLGKIVGVVGSYWNDSNTATLASSDYAYIENNRTIDKAIRGTYSSLIGDMNSPLVLNADGTLQDTTVAYFEGKAGVNTEQMLRDGELSAYKWTVDPAQNVLSTGKVIVSGQLVPVGVARQIQINIGFTPSIQ